MFSESAINSNFTSDTNINNLIFIDKNISGLDSYLNYDSSTSQLIVLDAERNGIEQISEVLATQEDVSSIHLISHGEAGKINLGNTELSIKTWDANRDRLQEWSKSLTTDADIILYGCNISANHDGLSLVNALADVTTADVAASDDLTGNAALGGDWDWETKTGEIEADMPFDLNAIGDYEGILATNAMADMSNMSDMEMNNMSDHMSGHEGHSSALLDLVPHSEATHIAIKNGHWFNPKVWKNGQVPGENANVLIPKGRVLWYGKKSTARLNTVRLDGRLRFASLRDTKMLVDTFVVSSEGNLKIGIENKPIQADKEAQIIFTSDKAIDTDWDTTQLSRGLISEG
ncbi:MAG: DUF4347 domain-containing protein, partial [Cyanobacteria bacterium J06600_6]